MKNKFMIMGAPADWCEIIYNDFIQNNEGLYIDGNMAQCGAVGRLLYKLSYSKMSNIKIGRNVIKKKLFACLDKQIKKANIELQYAIFCDWNRLAYDVDFLKHLRTKYKDIKFIFIFTNIVEKSGVVRFSNLEFIKDNYDLVITYDEGNAKKYGLTCHRTVYSKIDMKSDKEPCDVFFIGNAKERLETVLNVFKMLNNNGFKCCFYVNGVPEELQEYKELIHYNETMSYKEAVEYVQNAKCVLDICQEGANAITLRCCEALVYDKKLITNATSLKNEEFYDAKNIYFLEGNNYEGLVDFLKSDYEVKYEGTVPLFASKNLLTFIENRFTIN